MNELNSPRETNALPAESNANLASRSEVRSILFRLVENGIVAVRLELRLVIVASASPQHMRHMKPATRTAHPKPRALIRRGSMMGKTAPPTLNKDTHKSKANDS